MDILAKLSDVWDGIDYPFLIHDGVELKFNNICKQESVDLSEIKSGDVVALIGDFNLPSISNLLRIIDLQAIIVPLTNDTKELHEYFFESALVDVVIENNRIRKRNHGKEHRLIEALRAKKHAGLILFSTGTEGKPKATLHDLTLFLKKFVTPRPAFCTLNFLLFDHVGGLNTLLHTLFNKGIVITPKTRTVESVLGLCKQYHVEVLPTTPTFLRMMLISGDIPAKIPESLKIITYGTERMDQFTLDELCRLLPNIDFRQTFGTSELGIVRVKSEARDSLYMKIGGEGVETKTEDGVLKIRSQSRMVGYLNAPSPFDDEGWYDTKDVVEERNGFYKITGRIGETINVGGLKFMPSEVECVALDFPNVELVKIYKRNNPITGFHVEIIIQPKDGTIVDKVGLKKYMQEKLPPHMIPKNIFSTWFPSIIALKGVDKVQENIFFDIRKLGFLGVGARIGKTVRIRKPEKTYIGDGCIIDDFTYISCEMKIGNYCHIAPNVTISGGSGRFVAGDFVAIAAGCSIHAASSDYMTASLDWPSVPEEMRFGGYSAPVIFGDHVLLGAHTVVMPGVKLPDGVATGAHTVLRTRKYEPWTLYIGLNGKRLMKRDTTELSKRITLSS